MRTHSRTLVADVAMSLKGYRDVDSGHWWSGWKKQHWPADVLRRGFRFYGYDKGSKSLFALLEITNGSSFTYRTLADFERKVKQVAGYFPNRDDPHWKKLPLPAPGNFCTGFAIRWRRVSTVDIPWQGRFPQLGWANLSSDGRYIGDINSTQSFPEGDPKYRRHFAIERNPKLRTLAKTFWRSKLGHLRCLVCGFDFEQRYGPLGAEFIEMHHVKPLASGHGRRQTKVRELKPLCANCHRMVHHKLRNPLSPKVLARNLRPTTRSKMTAQ